MYTDFRNFSTVELVARVRQSPLNDDQWPYALQALRLRNDRIAAIAEITGMQIVGALANPDSPFHCMTLKGDIEEQVIKSTNVPYGLQTERLMTSGRKVFFILLSAERIQQVVGTAEVVATYAPQYQNLVIENCVSLLNRMTDIFSEETWTQRPLAIRAGIAAVRQQIKLDEETVKGMECLRKLFTVGFLRESPVFMEAACKLAIAWDSCRELMPPTYREVYAFIDRSPVSQYFSKWPEAKSRSPYVWRHDPA